MTETKPERFPKAELLKIGWAGWPSKIGGKRRWKPLYCRMANAAQIYLWPLQIIWRMPWLPQAAFSNGWDACWRQMYAEQEQLKAELAAARK